MYKYEFLMTDGEFYSISSKYHISMLEPKMFDGATFVLFDDVNFGVNLAQVKELKINGIVHRVKSYQM